MPELTATSLIDLLALGGVSSLAVATTGVAYGQSFPLPKNSSFSFELGFTSSGNVDVKVELEMGNERPTTEGSSDSAWVIPTGASALSSGITDEATHIIPYAPSVARFARLKLTGQGTNDASTVLSKAKVAHIRS